MNTLQKPPVNDFSLFISKINYTYDIKKKNEILINNVSRLEKNIISLESTINDLQLKINEYSKKSREIDKLNESNKILNNSLVNIKSKHLKITDQYKIEIKKLNIYIKNNIILKNIEKNEKISKLETDNLKLKNKLKNNHIILTKTRIKTNSQNDEIILQKKEIIALNKKIQKKNIFIKTHKKQLNKINLQNDEIILQKKEIIALNKKIQKKNIFIKTHKKQLNKINLQNDEIILQKKEILALNKKIQKKNICIETHKKQLNKINLQKEKIINGKLISTPKKEYITKKEFNMVNVTYSKIIKCIIKNKNKNISTKTNYRSILVDIWKSMSSKKILKTTKFNFKPTNEDGDKGFCWCKDINMSFQNKDSKGTLKEILNMVNVNNLTIDLSIKLKTGIIVHFKI